MSNARDRFMEELCNRHRSIALIFIISVLFMIVDIPWLVLTEPGSVLFLISVMNFVGLFVFASLSGWVLWKCSNRRNR